MRNVVLALGAIGFLSSPASASWEFFDQSDDMGRLLVAATTDNSEEVEIQAICDELTENMVLLAIYTGEEFPDGTDLFQSIRMSIQVDDTTYSDLYAHYTNVGGELGIEIRQHVTPQIHEIIGAMAGAAAPVIITYPGRTLRLDSTNAATTIPRILEFCPE